MASRRSVNTLQIQKYKEWLYGLPPNWIDKFVENGLTRFLKEYGYVLGFSSEKLIKIISSCLYNQSSIYSFCVHNGGLEEYDWYCYTISIDEWNKFMDDWKSDEFLDSSDMGFKQRLYLQDLVWHCISLEQSKQHRNWLYFMYDEDSSEEQIIYEDNGAYGGDRRTY